jgi:hypothetical protein
MTSCWSARTSPHRDDSVIWLSVCMTATLGAPRGCPNTTQTASWPHSCPTQQFRRTDSSHGSRASSSGHRAGAADEDRVLADEAVIASLANVHVDRLRFCYLGWLEASAQPSAYATGSASRGGCRKKVCPCQRRTKGVLATVCDRPVATRDQPYAECRPQYLVGRSQRVGQAWQFSVGLAHQRACWATRFWRFPGR